VSRVYPWTFYFIDTMIEEAKDLEDINNILLLLKVYNYEDDETYKLRCKAKAQKYLNELI